MRRTRMMLAGAAAVLSLSAVGTGVALAQTPDPELAEQCGSYNFFEWLTHHECHGHTPPYIVYWPSWS
jgi:hypothetical protein